MCRKKGVNSKLELFKECKEQIKSQEFSLVLGFFCNKFPHLA